MLKRIIAVTAALSVFFACLLISDSRAKLAKNSMPYQAAGFLGTETAENEFEKCAENSKFELYIIKNGDRKGEFCVKSKTNDAVWYSNPQNRNFEKGGLASATKESSQVILEVYSEKSSSARTVNSYKGSSNGKRITVSTKSGGFTSAYVLNGKIKLSLDVKLTEEGITVKSNFGNLKADESNIVSQVYLLPYFGCAAYGEDGYLFVPDGSGAIIYNNSANAKAKPYAQKVYGEDIAFASFIKTVNTQQTYIPAFGAVNKNCGYVAAIDEGAYSASVHAASATEAALYNQVYCSFQTVGSDKITLGESGSGLIASKETCCTDMPLTTDAAVTYMLIPENADYSEMARLYRKHIGLKQTDVALSPSMLIELYGGIERKESVAGVPMTVLKKFTTADEAQAIVDYFGKKITAPITLSYRNIDSAVIAGKLQDKNDISGKIGKESDLKKLKDSLDGRLFLENNICTVTESGNGFSRFDGVAQRINRNDICFYNYNKATTMVNSEVKDAFAVKTDVIQKAFTGYLKSVKESGYKTAFINLANTAYSDFNRKKYVSRKESIGIYTDLISKYGKDGLLYAPNAYSFALGGMIADTPVCSSNYDIIDEDIPFYQMVLSGCKEYSTVSLNLEADVNVTFLKAVESGASLKFTFIHDNITAIKNTAYDYLFGADFESRKEQAVGYQQKLEEIYQALGSRTVKSHKILNGGVRVTEFSNGSRILVNYSNEPVSTEYGAVKAQSCMIVGGVENEK